MFLMVGLLAMIAFSVDIGFLCVSHDQLQRSADAAALAGCWELIDKDAPAGLTEVNLLNSRAIEKSAEFAGLNHVLGHAPQLTSTDVQVGYLTNPSDPTSPLQLDGLQPPNAVRVKVQRSDVVNGKVPLFFARVFGTSAISAEAEATAALLTDIRGFHAPPPGKTVGILPFALDEPTCSVMLANSSGDDDWVWDASNEHVVPGRDGVSEVNLYPKGTGSPGNRGTVDIGSNNNSTRDIARQITSGISDDDFEAFGRPLELDADGNLYLNGDTGISAGVKDELASIIGEPKVVPVFREVTGNGNNGTYRIVAFVGIRVLDVKLTGSMTKKRVTIQPATVTSCCTIPASGLTNTSHYIYSPVWLVR